VKPPTVHNNGDCDSSVRTNEIRQMDSVESEVIIDDSNELRNRTSIRKKKTPLSRGNDFLWG
jgi:hypothetical protein